MQDSCEAVRLTLEVEHALDELALVIEDAILFFVRAAYLVLDCFSLHVLLQLSLKPIFFEKLRSRGRMFLHLRQSHSVFG